MIRALFSGLSGLRNSQVRMDVIGNNIANVSTVGYKGSRVTFRESFAQNLRGASRPTGEQGGTNPMQVGTGVNVGSIDQLFSQGTLEATGQPLDLALQGDALFVLSNGSRQYFTRSGNFGLDATGRIVSPGSGLVLQGVNANANGEFDGTSSIGDIQIQLGAKAPAEATSIIDLVGNLDARAEVDDTHTMGIGVYDALGDEHNLQIVFTNTGPGTWDWTVSCDSATIEPAGNGTVSFNPDGSLADFTYPGGGASITVTPANAEAFDLELNPGTTDGIDGLSGFANPSNAVVSRQDGYSSGDLTNINVDSRGTIYGSFSNGVTRALAQISLASFNNAPGLLKAGSNTWEESPNSGPAILDVMGSSTRTTVTPGALEASNVDISLEFSNMIVAQRGFQANARVITTADEMLNEVVNLKR